MTPEQRLRQSRVKFRILRDRAIRDYLAGKTDFLEGNFDRRTTLDAIALAYAEGFRNGVASVSGEDPATAKNRPGVAA